MWNHYKTYSILRKEATEHEKVFNYNLLPAVIIKNCLPMPILVSLQQELKTEEERKANNRMELLHGFRSAAEGSTDRGSGVKQQLGSYAFQRGEEKIFDTMCNQASCFDILLHFDKQNFVPKGIRLQQADSTADDEKEIELRDRDGRLFKVYARVDSSKAGVKVVLYAKNVLLCHTEQSIEFFYQKKTKDVAAMFDTAAEKFPLPVRDNRSQRQTNDSTMLTDRNKGDEPTIYIH